MEVRLRGQREPVRLAEVTRDDEHGVVGTTGSGKTFVTRRANIVNPGNGRHPFRVYLTDGEVLRVIEPSFEEVANDYASGLDVGVTLAEGEDRRLGNEEILSVLSATPQDQAAAEAAANGGHTPVGVRLAFVGGRMD